VVEELLGLNRHVPVPGAVVAVADQPGTRLGHYRFDGTDREPGARCQMDRQHFHGWSLPATAAWHGCPHG
jgi:hypothetical protein